MKPRPPSPKRTPASYRELLERHPPQVLQHAARCIGLDVETACKLVVQPVATTFDALPEDARRSLSKSPKDLSDGSRKAMLLSAYNSVQRQQQRLLQRLQDAADTVGSSPLLVPEHSPQPSFMVQSIRAKYECAKRQAVELSRERKRQFILVLKQRAASGDESSMRNEEQSTEKIAQHECVRRFTRERTLEQQRASSECHMRKVQENIQLMKQQTAASNKVDSVVDEHRMRRAHYFMKRVSHLHRQAESREGLHSEVAAQHAAKAAEQERLESLTAETQDEARIALRLMNAVARTEKNKQRAEQRIMRAGAAAEQRQRKIDQFLAKAVDESLIVHDQIAKVRAAKELHRKQCAQRASARHDAKVRSTDHATKKSEGTEQLRTLLDKRFESCKKHRRELHVFRATVRKQRRQQQEERVQSEQNRREFVNQCAIQKLDRSKQSQRASDAEVLNIHRKMQALRESVKTRDRFLKDTCLTGHDIRFYDEWIEELQK